MVKINFGSGNHPLAGWINVDLAASGRPDVVADLGRGMPFPTAAVDFIFSEDLVAYLASVRCAGSWPSAGASSSPAARCAC